VFKSLVVAEPALKVHCVMVAFETFPAQLPALLKGGAPWWRRWGWHPISSVGSVLGEGDDGGTGGEGHDKDVVSSSSKAGDGSGCGGIKVSKGVLDGEVGAVSSRTGVREGVHHSPPSPSTAPPHCADSWSSSPGVI
jgi:hypothetical protein